MTLLIDKEDCKAIVQALFTATIGMDNSKRHILALEKALQQLEATLHQLGVVDAETHAAFELSYGPHKEAKGD